MKLLSMKEIDGGRYLHRYELVYENRAGREKHYEIVSRRAITSPEELGRVSSGISMIVTQNDRLLLLKEFRMAINRPVYNLCAGMINEGESIEDCVKRELFEETGLTVKEIKQILPASYAAVAISDIMTNIVYVEAEEGEISGEYASVNEEIQAAFYDADELSVMLETEAFSSRSQLAAYQFCISHSKK
ncbi:MAG: NUDIX hydrolase [Lachnospiraceae bacterium]|nr:NUDIX hydrolase [Lachnospiraceae bacterium]